MTDPVSGLPFDDPHIELWDELYGIDQDEVSTKIAIELVRAADGADPDAAAVALRGPGGAVAIQGGMQRFVDKAVEQDKEAERHSAASRKLAEDARECARRRRELPGEPVELSNKSSQTRGQVLAGYEHRQQEADQCEARGDFEHRGTRPTLPARLIVAGVLALIEAFLLIWPVTNASVHDPKNMVAFAGLVLAFFMVNDYLPKHTGESIRLARDARAAAVENTSIGITHGRRGERAKGREILGDVDQGNLARTERRRNSYCGLLGLAVAVYAAVVFRRITLLAFPLGQSLTFAVLAATLITVFTAGGLILLAGWWARGNQLGDQLREYGEITTEGRLQANQLEDQARELLRKSHDAAETAATHLAFGAQEVENGYRSAAVGAQKAARQLRLPAVVVPQPENLYTSSRPVATRATENLANAAGIRREVADMLAEPAPFPAGRISTPWEKRTTLRTARPNPAFIDPSHRVGPHLSGDSPRRRRRWWRRKIDSVA
jgi:hypothetical protein